MSDFTDEIIEYIDRLFADTSVSVATTRSNLKHIADHCEALIECLPDQDEGDDL